MHPESGIFAVLTLASRSVLQDTLLMMGYSQDEAEEVIGRVLSIIDSTEHFLSQTIAVLEEVGIDKYYFQNRSLIHTCSTCALIRTLASILASIYCMHQWFVHVKYLILYVFLSYS